MTDHDDMLWRTDAVETVRSLRKRALSDQSIEDVPLDDLTGRVLAETITASVDAPPQSYATMDGFAFDATMDYPFTLRESEVFPEDETSVLPAGEAVKIATGAPLPAGANAVLKREESTVEDGKLSGAQVEPGTYVYPQGSNFQAGETLFEAGERLSAKDAILLGDLGRETISVRDRFSVGIVATGTEIHEGRMRDLDSAMLAGLVRSWGHDATYEGSSSDDYEQVESLIEKTARTHDVVLTTGGTSVGHKDFVIRALSSLGDVLFHRVRVRPGKPIAAARLPDHDAVAFAIPGKPVGAHTIAALVTRPFFTGETALAGVTATLSQDVGLGPEGFEYVIPVTFAKEAVAGAEPTVVPLGHRTSALQVYDDIFNPSVLSSSTRTTRADGVIITKTALNAGDRVTVVPYSTIE